MALIDGTTPLTGANVPHKSGDDTITGQWALTKPVATPGGFNFTKNGDFEVWNAGTVLAPTDWSLVGAGATVGSSGGQKIGAACAIVVRAGTDCALTQSVVLTAGPIALWQSRPVVLGAWVKCSTNNRARLGIYDGTNTYTSPFHSGSGAWEFLSVAAVLGAGITDLLLMLRVDTGNVAGYFDGVVFALGSGLTGDWWPSGLPITALYQPAATRALLATAPTNDSLTFVRNYRKAGVTAMEAEVGGALLLRMESDKALSLVGGSGSIRALVAGTGTCSVTSGLNTFGTSSAQSFHPGETVQTAGGKKYQILAGSGTAWTLTQLATATETTVSFTHSDPAAGRTLGGPRSPGALYFPYLWNNAGVLDAYLDTIAPIATGYHPINTEDRWSGVQVWNTLGDVIDQSWMWLNGVTRLRLTGSKGGGINLTATTYADLDAVNLKRPVFVPGATGNVRATFALTAAGTFTLAFFGLSLSLSGALTALTPEFVASGGGAGGFMKGTNATRDYRISGGLQMVSLIAKVASGTCAIENGATDFPNLGASAGDTHGYPELLLEITEL